MTYEEYMEAYWEFVREALADRGEDYEEHDVEALAESVIDSIVTLYYH